MHWVNALCIFQGHNNIINDLYEGWENKFSFSNQLISVKIQHYHLQRPHLASLVIKHYVCLLYPNVHKYTKEKNKKK